MLCFRMISDRTEDIKVHNAEKGQKEKRKRKYEPNNPGWGRYFPHSSRPVLGPTQSPAQWVPSPSRG